MTQQICSSSQFSQQYLFQHPDIKSEKTNDQLPDINIKNSSTRQYNLHFIFLFFICLRTTPKFAKGWFLVYCLGISSRDTQGTILCRESTLGFLHAKIWAQLIELTFWPTISRIMQYPKQCFTFFLNHLT